VRTGDIALERGDGGPTVLTITGEHDLNTAPDLRAKLEETIDAGEATVVDLSPATFVDSSILGVILDARRRADENGTGFAVVQTNGVDAVSRVLDVTGLRTELPVHAERSQAAQEAAALGKADG
jgi:anti-sigma B factor antagonist